TRINEPIEPGPVLHMRVQRSGNHWTQSYSYDGATWTDAATFQHSLEVASVGVFAANSGGSSAPRLIASVDYVFNSANPVAPEDPDVNLDTTPPIVHGVSVDSRSGQVEVSWLINETSSVFVEYGLTESYELGVV